MKKERRWVGSILVLLGIMGLVAWHMPRQAGSFFGLAPWWSLAWIINLCLLLGIVICISLWAGTEGAKGGTLAILVDKNRMSLSRFQIVLWTVVVLSAFWTIAIARAADSLDPENAAAYVCEVSAPEGEEPALEEVSEVEKTATEEEVSEMEKPVAEDEEPCVAAPADLQLPAELWALMGISLTSAVASPLIKESKKQRTKDEPEYELVPDSSFALSLDAEGYRMVGAVLEGKEDKPGAPGREPKLSDLFMGEDPGNFAFVDMARVQNFFFTIVAVVVYGGILWVAMAGAESISALFQFPDLSEGLVAILGISHAGYLVNKNTAVPPPAEETPIACPNSACGAKNPAGSKFCSQCGTALP